MSHDKDYIEKYWQLGDEWANKLTHGVGFILSFIGQIFLIAFPLLEGNLWKLFSYSIFGSSLITLYGTSTIYHSAKDFSKKHLFRLLDHCAIYLLIAGSYTPFTLIALQGPWGWSLFAIVWSLAILGICFKVFFIGKFHKTSACIYLLMGWLVVIAIEPLINSLTTESLYLVFAGGMFYTLGIIFFLFDHKRFYHAIWHLFVLGGSACHYFAVLWYL